MTILGIHITNEEWLLLPLRLRQRWWDETDFGRIPPSEDLKKAINKELNKDIGCGQSVIEPWRD